MLNHYVIGDVHGCFYTLKKLISKLPKDADIIFVGDLVDKGNFSKEVVEFVIENRYQCVLGNHEYLMLNNINDLNSQWATVKGFGGAKTIESYKDDKEILEKHLEWIKTLPSYIVYDKYFITHGFGLPYYKRRDEAKSKLPLMGNRNTFTCKVEWGHDWEEDYLDYDIFNIFGHDYGSKPTSTQKYHNIDSGCVYGEKLTAISLVNRELITVSTDKRDTMHHERE